MSKHWRTGTIRPAVVISRDENAVLGLQVYIDRLANPLAKGDGTKRTLYGFGALAGIPYDPAGGPGTWHFLKPTDGYRWQTGGPPPVMANLLAVALGVATLDANGKLVDAQRALSNGDAQALTAAGTASVAAGQAAATAQAAATSAGAAAAAAQTTATAAGTAAASAQATANTASTAAAGGSTAAAAAQTKANTAATAAAAAQATADANATAITALAARVAKLEAQAVTGTRGRKSQPISLAIGATMDIVIAWDRAMPSDAYAAVAWIAPNASSLTLLGNLAMIYPAKSQTTTTSTFTVKNTGLLALSGTAVVEAMATTNGIT